MPEAESPSQSQARASHDTNADANGAGVCDFTGGGRRDGSAEVLTFAEVLDVLGHSPDGFIAIGLRPVGRGFRASMMRTAAAEEFVFWSLTEQSHTDVYFSVNALGAALPAGRGKESDVTRWLALYSDLDVKPGAFTTIAAALVCIATLSAMLGTRPSVIIYSGHGLQPLWPIEDGVLDTEAKWEAAARLSRRFGRLVATVAWCDHHASVDSVFDLSRLLRVSRTFNYKEHPRRHVMAYAVSDTGAPLSVERIEEVCDEWGATLDVPKLDSDTPVRGPVISAPQDWRFAGQDCCYVTAMVTRWGQESDRPKAGRHQWAMDRCVRLACAQRLGCLTSEGLTAALEHLGKCLAHWCAVVGEPRELHRNEIGGAWDWGVRAAAVKTEEQARAELGGHGHDARKPFGSSYRWVPVRVPVRRQQTRGWHQ